MTDGWYFASLLGWALAWMALVRPLRLGQALLCAVCGMLLTAYLGVIVLPLRQHVGAPATPCVQVGDTVKAGQLVAAAAQGISANIHSSVDGVVTAVENGMILIDRR